MRLAAVAIERDGAGTQRDRERGREGERRRDGEQCEHRVGNYSTMNIN